MNDAYAIVNSLGTGALMNKTDLKNAFRLFSVRPRDWFAWDAVEGKVLHRHLPSIWLALSAIFYLTNCL